MVIGTAYSASFDPPQWAFGTGEKGKPYPDDGQPKHLTGARSGTGAELMNRSQRR